MKANIDSLVNAWIRDNRNYIEDNFEDVYSWLKEYITYGDNWEYDFFDYEECETREKSELKEEALEYISKYIAVTPSDILD